MPNGTGHKFQETISLTYEQHFKRLYTNTVKLLRKLESSIGKEPLQTILKEWSVERGVEMAGDRRVESFKEFKDYWKSASVEEYIFHASTVEFPEESETVLQCKITECLWAQTFRELDAAELGKIMLCDPDFPFASTMNPKLKLERTKTLMEGHDCCDSRYTWTE